MTENVWCAVNTLSLCPLSTLCLSFYPSPLSLYISLSPVSHTVCYCITVTYILLKKIKACLFLLHAWKCSVETINIGGGKYKNDDDDVAMKTNLTCKYLYEERFPSFSFCSFWFLGLREFLSSASQCVTVSVNSLQCLSVCQSRSPYISFPTCILILRFEVLMLFVYSLFFLSFFPPSAPHSAPPLSSLLCHPPALKH